MSHSPEALLLETIAVRDGIPQRLEKHEARMSRSRKALLDLEKPLPLHLEIPTQFQTGLVKCRVHYGHVVHSIHYFPYTPRTFENIAIAQAKDINYSHKFADRAPFNELEAKANGSLVIIDQNGYLTDANFANIAVFDGEQWLTPKHYLLNGIMRQWLLERKIIQEAAIRTSDLSQFTALKLVNAMLEWDESPEIALDASRIFELS